MLWPQSTAQQTLRELYAFNMDEDTLRERFLEPYRLGGVITWSGRSIEATDIAWIRIAASERPLQHPSGHPSGGYGLFVSVPERGAQGRRRAGRRAGGA